MDKERIVRERISLAIRILPLLILISVLVMGFAGCGNMGDRSEKEGLTATDDELSFVVSEDLLSRMDEKGYDSLTVYSQKVKT